MLKNACLFQKRNQGEHGCSPFNTVSLRGCSALLGCDQLVNLGAEVLQNEVFFGRSLAFVNFLRPLFQRNLDAESFVDSEYDVEEVEAVNAKIVDGMAIRRDGVTVDFAGLMSATLSKVEDKFRFLYSWRCLNRHASEYLRVSSVFPAIGKVILLSQ